MPDLEPYIRDCQHQVDVIATKLEQPECTRRATSVAQEGGEQ